VSVGGEPSILVRTRQQGVDAAGVRDCGIEGAARDLVEQFPERFV
jgi:hypothetical protein